MKKMATLVVAILLVGCQEESHRKLLEEKGYTQIQIHEGSFNCGPPGPEIGFNSTFEAVNPKGKKVKGSVCNGLFGPSIEEE